MLSALEPWMTDAVATALREVGCPPDTAQQLAWRTRIDRQEGGWLLLLLGHGTGIDVPVERTTWQEAAEAVARNIAADNAEAVDRAGRGQPGWTPLWPLSDRRPRS